MIMCMHVCVCISMRVLIVMGGGSVQFITIRCPKDFILIWIVVDVRCLWFIDLHGSILLCFGDL